ncbi:MAG: hypothetical protein B6D68_01785 [spirochete symbiont of Stewartia floridana]|nr:MAG: hypothetical protein B6D68_01785 [spirochete symbiont of Stewartia floridana]
MTVVREASGICTVIVTVDAPAETISEMEFHARDGLVRFKEYKGFVSGALHKSTDGKRLIQYLQWETEADHLACMNDPRWDDRPSTRRFMEHVESGGAQTDVRVYEVVSSSKGRE